MLRLTSSDICIKRIRIKLYKTKQPLFASIERLIVLHEYEWHWNSTCVFKPTACLCFIRLVPSDHTRIKNVFCHATARWTLRIVDLSFQRVRKRSDILSLVHELDSISSDSFEKWWNIGKIRCNALDVLAPRSELSARASRYQLWWQ
jgi:hypothetical protein